MKRSILILLTFACLVPFLSHAREETMGERKKRITRKYMREYTAIAQSESVVPELSAEDQKVLDSEKFKGPTVDLQSQAPGMAPLPPVPRRPAPTTDDRNWLLAADPDLSPGDPSADPFAAKELDGSTKTKPDWMKWTTKRDSSSTGAAQSGSRFDRRGYIPPSQQTDTYGSSQQGLFHSRNPNAYSSYGTQSGAQQGSAVKTWGSPTPAANSGLDLSGDKVLNPTLNQGRLNSPFPATGTGNDRSLLGTDSQQRQGGYTPYKSPYQTQRNQRQQQGGTYDAQKREFQRNDTFQTWKEQNPTRFDSTRDDAFVDELMPKVRR